jgi:hypothetical protein
LVEPVADRVDGEARTLTVRLVPQRPVRFASLHVAAADAELRSAVVAGRPVTVADPPAGRWGFGVVFHAPPPEGIEITLVFRQLGAELRLRAMDASDGLTGLPGFRPRPPEVGVAGTHSSELLAVARTYPF